MATAVDFHFPAKSGKQADTVDRRRRRRRGRRATAGAARPPAVHGRRQAHRLRRGQPRLAELTGAHFTAKDFRTWKGSSIGLRATCASTWTGGPPDSTVVAAVDAASEMLNNTRIVCRSHYVHPDVVDGFTSGRLARFLAGTDCALHVPHGRRAADARLPVAHPGGARRRSHGLLTGSSDDRSSSTTRHRWRQRPSLVGRRRRAGTRDRRRGCRTGSSCSASTPAASTRRGRRTSAACWRRCIARAHRASVRCPRPAGSSSAAANSSRPRATTGTCTTWNIAACRWRGASASSGRSPPYGSTRPPSRSHGCTATSGAATCWPARTVSRT